MCLTAPFVETKSTCGAAISTTTSVDGGADDDWKQDENGDDIKKLMLRKIALQVKCGICDKTKAETKFSSSEEIKLRRGEPGTCQSCHPVGHSGRDFLSCHAHACDLFLVCVVCYACIMPDILQFTVIAICSKNWLKKRYKLIVIVNIHPV